MDRPKRAAAALTSQRLREQEAQRRAEMSEPDEEVSDSDGAFKTPPESTVSDSDDDDAACVASDADEPAAADSDAGESESESDSETTALAFVEGVLSDVKERGADEEATLLDFAFTINKGALGSAAEVQQALRDFNCLAKAGRADLLLQRATQYGEEPLDPVVDQVLLVFEDAQFKAQSLIQRATVSLVAQLSRCPQAFLKPDAAVALLWRWAHVMPAVKRASLFKEAPPGSEGELAQSINPDSLVVRACEAQLDTALSLKVDGDDNVDNARFLLRNVAGGIFELVQRARAADAGLDAVLAELRAARRAGGGADAACTARFGRKLKDDPPEPGHVKAVIKHVTRLPDGDFTTRLVHHVTKAQEVCTQADFLALFAASADTRVGEFLQKRAAQGCATLKPEANSATGVRRFELITAEEYGVDRCTVVLRVIKDTAETDTPAAEFTAHNAMDARVAAEAFAAYLTVEAVGHGPADFTVAVCKTKDSEITTLKASKVERFNKKTPAGLVFDPVKCASFAERIRSQARKLVRKNHSVHITVHLDVTAPKRKKKPTAPRATAVKKAKPAPAPAKPAPAPAPAKPEPEAASEPEEVSEPEVVSESE